MAKWHTICSCGSAQDLEKMINSYYCSEGYVLGDEINNNHFEVINTKTMRKARTARYYRKHWQYGYYLDNK